MLTANIIDSLRPPCSRTCSGAALAAAMLLVLLSAPALAAKHVEKNKDKWGTTYWGKYDHAPYPAKGFKYKDNSIAVFVPKGFCARLIRAKKKRGKDRATQYFCHSEKKLKRLKRKGYRVKKETTVDYVVHFHGHSNTVAKTFKNHKLREQFALSLQNAILVVPQGPINAIDSNFGKIEKSKGFRKMLMEVHGHLQERGIIGSRQKVGKIIITSHSGGYQAAAMAVKHGGLEISEVYLFDSLYAYKDVFFAWLSEPDKGHRRFINVYYRKKPKARSKELMALMRKEGVRFAHFKQSEIRSKKFERKRLARERIIFVRTDLGHSGCTREDQGFRDYLFSSRLRRVKSTDWFKKTGVDKLKVK